MTEVTPDYDQFVRNEQILSGQEEPIIAQPSAADVQAAWDKMKEDNPWFAPAKSEPLPPCPHTFMFSLNANHTVVRGCIHCGQTDVSLAMGDPVDLRWHRIQEGGEG